MRTIDWTTATADERRAALARPDGRSDPTRKAAVREIVEDVRRGGWDALVAHGERIDGARPQRIEVATLADRARDTLTEEALAALRLAHRNIKCFHAGTMPSDHAVETMPGLVVRKVWRSIERVGLYVPGGATPLFSTLMMLAIPARIAGVGEIVVVTPPRPDGGCDPVLALAARMCGIEAIWTVGGAQAIAALAWGAGDIPRVGKICGPGNAWVAEAKAYVAAVPGGPAMDLPAGPSELMVIADAGADAALVAADLLSQAEHDAAAQVILVTDDAALAAAVTSEVERRSRDLPRRAIVAQSLDHGRALIVADLDQAVAVANAYAPEHLSLAVGDPDALVGRIVNSGAIFAGAHAAETFGDYLAGSSHVLPTDGAARAWSGISVLSFLKSVTVQSVTPAAARAIAGPAAALARLEGLEAHARAADARLAQAA